MVVGDDAFTHGGAYERELCAVNEIAHLIFGVCPRHALSNEYERSLGAFKYVQGSLDVLRRCHHARRLRHTLNLDDVVEVTFAGDDVIR